MNHKQVIMKEIQGYLYHRDLIEYKIYKMTLYLNFNKNLETIIRIWILVKILVITKIIKSCLMLKILKI